MAIPPWVFWILAIFGGIILIFSGGNLVLRHQVKKRTQELKESEEELKSIFDSSPYGIIVTNLEGIIVKSNKRALMLQNVATSEELSGTKAFEIFIPEELERARNVIRSTLNNETMRNQLFRLKRSDGTTYPGEVSTNLVVDAKGKPRFVVSITQDVTERIKLESEREKAKKEAEFYADVLIHDVANLSQIIEGYLYLIENEKVEKVKEEYIKGINKTVGRTSDLVMNIKMVKAIQTSKVKKFNLRKAIENSISIIKENFTEEIIFENNVEEDCYLVANDFLENAFINILKNAIEYSNEPVKIKINSKPEKGYSKITITDRGRGISEEIIDDLANYLEDHSKRIGLGLFFVKLIVEKFNGIFELEQRKEKGTTIIMRLPLYKVENK